MPEGHTIHRLSGALDRRFRGTVVAASSPQGRFAAGADLIDGTPYRGARAHGKHLFVSFGGGARGAGHAGRLLLHVHLGLYGTFVLGAGQPPAERGALRLRLLGDAGGDAPPAWGELRGPTACELLDPGEVGALEARLGPDPLEPDPGGLGRALFTDRVRASRSPVGGLLMRQDLVAGIGNIYRAEVLFRAGLHPQRPGRQVDAAVLGALWDDLVVLMRSGVRSGRIVTTEPEHRLRAGRSRAVGREDAHYVYGRTGLPCRVCATPVASGPMVGRTVYWCPSCQPG